MKLSPSDVYHAVARQIPDPLQPTTFINNTNVSWDQVNGSLPYRPIALFGPMRETPLRLLFESLLLEPGCNAQRSIEALRMTDPGRHAELCHSVRADRLYSEVEQTASLIPQQLWADPNALLLVDYPFYRDNQSQLAGSMLEGPEPSPETFADGTYPLARPIYVYTDWSRLGRVEQGFEILESLRSLRLSGQNRFGLVYLDEREDREQRSRRSPTLSESDLISEKE
jgi:phosphate transport system substrate-binding protein